MPKRQVKKKKSGVQIAFTRFLLVVAIFVIWMGVISVRLVHLQVSQHQTLKDKAVKQRSGKINDKPLRGSILDRSERVLALSIKSKSLFVDPVEIEDIEGTAFRLAGVLGEKPLELAGEIRRAKESNRRFVWLARKLSDETAQKIEELGLDGVHFQEEQKRNYPHGTLGSHVIGFSNVDDVGQSGVELSQEKMLRGTTTEVLQTRDRLGRVYDESENKSEPPKDVVLTLDYKIQYKVEQALAKGVMEANAKSGSAIVMNPKNGEILALANVPDFDPNKYNEVLPDTLTNRATQSFYTPGSTFKLVTYGAALEEGLISPDSFIDCSKGSIEVAGHLFKDSHPVKSITYTDAMAFSSNVAAVKTGLQIGRERFHNYAVKFGFGQETGIELPAEADGILRSVESWNPDSLPSMSLGYEIGVTALQTASSFATIANDGVRIQPHIIKQIKQADGSVIEQAQPKQTQIVSAETARALRQMLQKVVLAGTGVRAQINGYSVAGKTGTAWKYDPKLKKVNENKYVSSFAGFAPLNNPEVVIVVVLDEPQGEYRDGGHVAAPIFREIAEQLLPEMGIEPDGTKRDTKAPLISEDNKRHVVSKTEKKSDDKDEKKAEKKVKVEETEVKKEEKTAVKEKSETKDAEEKKAEKDTKKAKSETKNKSSGREKT